MIEAITKLVRSDSLSEAEASAAFETIMRGDATPVQIAEGHDERPRMARSLIVVDRESGRVLAACAIEVPSLEAELGARFVEAMLSIGSRPERLLVRSLAVRDLLAPLGAGLGAELRRVQRLRIPQWQRG